MTGYGRCLAVIEGGTPDRVPAYSPTIASDVAGRILGRTVHTGGPALWYAEAAAWCDGPNAWQEFDCQVMEDIIDLHRALAQDVIWPEMAQQAEKGVQERIVHASETAGVQESRLQERLGNSMMVVAGGAGLSLGVDEAHLMAAALEPGAVEDAYRHSMELLEASAGRRYFHGCSNTILPGTPPGNARAMMKARDDFSRQLDIA